MNAFEGPDSSRIESLIERLQTAWRSGNQLTVETLLQETSTLDLAEEALVELIYAEYQIRIEIGDSATGDEYLSRFPRVAHRLKRLFALHRELNPKPSTVDELHGGDENTIAFSKSTRESTILGLGAGSIGSARDSAGDPGKLRSERERFRIKRPHAKGGLGEVFVAEDLELGRDVALKMIRSDRNLEASRARFMKEAQITGRLEHPGVAPVYALDVDAKGAPRYAMRFIEGRSLREAIVEHRKSPSPLGFRELLQRFVSVCNTIAFAHSKGIIHRDLKPANVMLGAYGETLVVDWGLAKQFQVESTTETTTKSDPSSESSPRDSLPTDDETQEGQILGTLPFMAPEQAAGDLKAQGPGSDIFALGAILFQILTGEPWLRVSQGGAPAAIRRVLEGNVPGPRSIDRTVPSALNAVCLKAMAAEPKNRYATATELALEIERFLADERVLAYREPVLVKTRRWMRRHRTWVASAASLAVMALVALAVGLVVVSGYAGEVAKANSQLSKANGALEQSNKELEESNAALLKAQAQQQASEADTEAFAQYMEFDVLGAARPVSQEGGQGVDLRLIDAIRFAATQASSRLGSRPRAEARARLALGRTLQLVDDPAGAIAQYQQAERLLERQLGNVDDTSRVNSQFGQISALREQGHVEQALALLEPLRQQLEKTRPAHDRSRLTATMEYARILMAKSDDAGGVRLLREVDQLFRAHYPLGDRDALVARAALATALSKTLQLQEAIALQKEILAQFDRMPNASALERAVVQGSLAINLGTVGYTNEAIQVLESQIQQFEELAGADHSFTLRAKHNLAFFYKSVGRLEQAAALFAEVVAQREESLGFDHPHTIGSLYAWAETLYLQGDFPSAKIHATEALKRARRAGVSIELLVQSLEILARVHASLNNKAEARNLFAEATAAIEQRGEQKNMYFLAHYNERAIFLREIGELQEALEVYRKLERDTAEVFGDTHLNTLITRGNMAGIMQRLEQIEPAATLLEKTYQTSVDTLGPGSHVSCEIGAKLVDARMAQNRFEEAHQLIEKLLTHRGAGVAERRDTLRFLLDTDADALASLGRRDEELARRREVVAWLERYATPDKSPRRFLDAHFNLGSVLLFLKKPAEAEPHLRKSVNLALQLGEPQRLCFPRLQLSAALILLAKESKESDPIAFGRFIAEAESLLTEGQEGLRAELGAFTEPVQSQLQHAMFRRWIDLCQLTGRAEEAARWQTEWEAWKSTQTPSPAAAQKSE